MASVRDEPRCPIILTRCASPPERVPDDRSSERYPSPISTNESRLSCNAASKGATDGSPRSRTHVAKALISMAQASAMLTPLILDDLAASLSRVPPQSGQAVKVTARSTKARMCGCIDSLSLDRIDFWTRRTRPSYVMFIPAIFILVGSRWSKSCSSVLVNLRHRLVGVVEA